MSKQVESFDFEPGRILANKYEIHSQLGGGWEGEVYKLIELETGIERAAKFFFPHRNPKNRTLRFYAKKLHKLRHCKILIHYNTQEQMQFCGQKISYLVSEYVEGVLLSDFLASHRGKRITFFEGLHLLYGLALGLESVHRLKEYHGDLHPENIIITRFGLNFDMKLIDLFHWKTATTENIEDDVHDLVRIFYDALGGPQTYTKHPKEIRKIISGLKKSLIRKNFRTAGNLRLYLENLRLDSLMGDLRS